MSDLLERFLRYVRIDTQSNPDSASTPSTEKQWELARLLVREMEEMGLEDVRIDEKAYITATLPSNVPDRLPVIGFIAHFDTSPDFSGTNVRPRLVPDYDGGDIVLNAESGVVLSPEYFPELRRYTGQTLVVTDGNTLLGADDKAGIAEILTAAEYLIQHPEIPHGTIRIGFTPDEEIGRGAHHFDVGAFGADWAYTIDGSQVGELEFENFNAARAVLTAFGTSVHPGYAKNKMVNAITTLQEILSGLPPGEVPEKTSGREGFFHLHQFQGGIEEARAELIIRDHDRETFEKRKSLLRVLAEETARKRQARVEVQIEDQYYNMREKILPVYPIVEVAEQAMRSVGVEPLIQPIRGGTDGSQLSYKGLPCPNIFAGGHNFHGKFEYVPVESMEKAVEVIVKICELTASKPPDSWKNQPK
ncbi:MULTISPECIES: peptidase T [unclassified Robiginitalea]|uniref:peptidase T n=1 Tax=Robiginitalea TaxID=252306 RepID=UPI00234B67E7|nr:MULTISPECIES: peptidase T [unclassified Robiginitalea]MDC6355267.1 peptidase T [Robiginitalea sp. PM2]MDC6375518.1 peptidase T [Robiginitalea sp. SP8]